MHGKKVKDLAVGDKTEWYTVRKVWREGEKVCAEVQFNDGGTSSRVWDNPEFFIIIIK